jgi:GR25 family glycosyltransferase involved in LPS biosynthesis
MNYIENFNVNLLKFNFSFKKQHIINEKTEEIFVINLLSNKLRRNYIIMLMKKLKINFTLVIVEPIPIHLFNILNKNKKLTKSELGCTLSHMWCLNKIISDNLQSAIIFEDDIIFHRDFKPMFQNIIQLKKYDFLLLGACDFSFSKININNVNNKGLYRPNPLSSKVYGAHAIYYSLVGAQKMFNYINENIYFIDRNFHCIFDYFPETSFICYPNLIVSDISTTNIGHNYPFFSNKEKNYYLDCFKNFQFTDYHFFYLSFFNNLNSQSLNILEIDNYEIFIDKLINILFPIKEEQNILKKRLVYDFFTMNDLKFLLNF